MMRTFVCQALIFVLLLSSTRAACDARSQDFCQACKDSDETLSASLNLLQTKMAVSRSPVSSESETEEMSPDGDESAAAEPATVEVSSLDLMEHEEKQVEKQQEELAEEQEEEHDQEQGQKQEDSLKPDTFKMGINDCPEGKKICKCKQGQPGPRSAIYVENMCCPEGYLQVKTEAACKAAFDGKQVSILDWKDDNDSLRNPEIMWKGVLRSGKDKRPLGCILVWQNSRNKHGQWVKEVHMYFNTPVTTPLKPLRAVDKVICQKAGSVITGKPAPSGGSKPKPSGGGGGLSSKQVITAYEAGLDKGYTDAEKEWEESNEDDD